MAVDTRNKRASAISTTLPWRGLLPAPDGTIDEYDRQQVAFVYAGILAGEPIIVSSAIPSHIYTLHGCETSPYMLTGPNTAPYDLAGPNTEPYDL